jgi:hypothetical protein
MAPRANGTTRVRRGRNAKRLPPVKVSVLNQVEKTGIVYLYCEAREGKTRGFPMTIAMTSADALRLIAEMATELSDILDQR